MWDVSCSLKKGSLHRLQIPTIVSQTMTPRANGDHSALLQTGVPENVKKFKKFEKMYMLQNICVMVTTNQVAFVCVFFSFLQFFMRRNNSLRLFDIKKNEEGQEQALSDKKQAGALPVAKVAFKKPPRTKLLTFSNQETPPLPLKVNLLTHTKWTCCHFLVDC